MVPLVCVTCASQGSRGPRTQKKASRNVTLQLGALVRSARSDALAQRSARDDARACSSLAFHTLASSTGDMGTRWPRSWTLARTIAFCAGWLGSPLSYALCSHVRIAVRLCVLIVLTRARMLRTCSHARPVQARGVPHWLQARLERPAELPLLRRPLPLPT